MNICDALITTLLAPFNFHCSHLMQEVGLKPTFHNMLWFLSLKYSCRSPTLTLTDSTDQLATAYPIYLVLLLRGICYRHFLTGKISFHSFAIEFLLINLQLNLTYHASALFRFTLSCLRSVYESALSERVLTTLLCQYYAKFLPAVLATTLNI